LSTHIVEDVENLCDRLAVLAGGRILVEGSAAELTARHQGRLWSALVPRGQPLPQALHLAAHPRGTRVVCQGEAPPDSRFAPHPPRLEDVYHLTLAGAGLAEAA
jgi:ABC-type multidrug transport system ATPase subunit